MGAWTLVGLLEAAIPLRLTLTRDHVGDVGHLLNVMETEGVQKFYLSPFNYGGRGHRHRGADAVYEMTRGVMDRLFDTALRRIKVGETPEFVTGNNDADGAYLIQWAQRHFPEHVPTLRAKLRQWGGNASGVDMAHIENLGEVHPDTFWWHYPLGNVRKRSFSSLWFDDKDLLMRGLRQRPRAVTGLCVQSQYLDVCNGNTRVRAHQTTVDFWAEDPGCYLDDDEIGLSSPMEIDQ